MKIKLFHIVLIVLLILSPKFGLTQKSDTNTYVMLCQVLNDDKGNKDAAKICGLLESNDVECVYAGSIGLTISVPKKDVAIAWSILRKGLDKGEVEIHLTQESEGWPKDIFGLIAHLNHWDKEDMDVYERPEQYPGRVSSGETNAWVELHKELLKELGAFLIWDSKELKYKVDHGGWKK